MQSLTALRVGNCCIDLQMSLLRRTYLGDKFGANLTFDSIFEQIHVDDTKLKIKCRGKKINAPNL